DFGGAVSFFEKLTSYYPEEKEAWLRLTDLYTQLGNEAKAEESGFRALRLVSDTPFEKDVMLNEIEILKRKTLLSSRVKRLWVTVTTRCNIQCKTCGLWPYKWDLPYETAKEVMELYPYLERLVWLGGEVFLYKHFEEMFDKASVYPNLRQQVITNGVILDRRWIEKIVKTVNTELTFSVDGTTKEVYESIRCGSNFEKLLENIRLTMKLKKELNPSLDVRMNALIMKSNYHQLEGLLDFARDLGFNQITYLTVHFDNSPGENIFYENRDPEILKKIGEAIPKLREKAKTCRMDIDILLPPGALDFGDIVRKEEPTAAKPDESVKKPPRDHRKGIYCKMPWKYMMICDQGGVLLTGSCIKPIGNINENSLHDIWNSPDARLYRKKMLANEFEGLCRTECASRW
ncbi:MAG TPA: radical SAM protein, partial [bacterium]|nr:radical SAM protein [bacterium]